MPRNNNWRDLVEDPDDIGRRCLMCGDPFVAQRSTKRYCSANCRVNAYRYPQSEWDARKATQRACKVCNCPITYDERSDKQFCSATCRQRWHRLPITWGEQVTLYNMLIEADSHFDTSD
jgi:predicted nucleic acid-binding Zn ribbon protein